jgi:hypothetical protein
VTKFSVISDRNINKSSYKFAVIVSHLSGSVLVIFEDFMAVTMKNAVFWDIKAQFIPHRWHITSPL